MALNPNDIDRLVTLELSRRNFWEFCLYYDEEFFTKRPFLKKIADAFQRIYERKIKRLAISMPPRAGKSYITTLFCAWLIGNKPEGSVMRNCCTSTLYNKFSYDTREVIRSDKFKAVFPEVQLSKDKQNVEGWNTTKALQVSYFGAGVGGTIIGFGASTVAITDDLIRSFEDAISDKMLDKTHSWYDGTHGSRQEKDCPVIDIGTRWSKKDTIGRQAEDNFYDEVISISALDENNKSFCEEVKSTEEYQDIQRRTAPEIWNAEYMQSPIEASGTLFTKSGLNRFKMHDLKLYDVIDGKQVPLFESVLGYIDVADEGTDKLAFATGFVVGKKVFITDIIFTGKNIDDTVPLCSGLINKLKHDYVRVEANNQGKGFAKELRQHVPEEKILTVKNTTNKHTRILMQYGFIKEHFYFRDDYERNSEYDLFMCQLFDYVKAGSSTKDDAPDCIAGLAKFVQGMLPHVFEKHYEEPKEQEAA